MWKLSIEDDQGEKTSVNLVRDEYTIGRAETNTIRLTERNISREHARLFRRENAWYLADRESYNGAYVNGARVVEPVRIAHGDLVQLGDYRLEVVDEALATTRTHPTMRDGLASTTGRRDTLVNQPDRFVMVVGPAPGTEYPLTSGRMIIGRGEECDISINHASVSRVHAEVHAVGDGRYELIDKGSANGVRVNAVELQRALIDARDNIELGDVILKYVPAGDIYVPGADESQRLGAAQLAAEAFSLSADPYATKPALPFAIKAAAGLLGVGLLVLLGVFVIGGKGAAPPAAPSAATNSAAAKSADDGDRQADTQRDAPKVSPASLALEEASRLIANGDVFGAHAKLLELPPGSSERQSEAATQIENQWAEALIEAAHAEPDLQAKRALLDQVAKNTAVDQQKRDRAAELVEALDSQARQAANDSAPGKPPMLAPKSPSQPSQARVRNKQDTTQSKAPTQTTPRTPKRKPASAPAEKPPTLVRDDPFGEPSSSTSRGID